MIFDFIDNVIKQELEFGWKFEIETIDTYGSCYRELKLFTVPEYVIKNRAFWVQKEYVLHEVAHALDKEGRGDSHNADFYKIYTKLLIKYAIENK